MLTLGATGLSVHMNQVHKENLTTVENALPNRANLDIEIFGMEGIPDDVVASHHQRVLSQFRQAEAERRAATGNPAPGTATGQGSKKPKVESPEELKKRLAEHRARVARGSAGSDSGGATPTGAHHPNFIQNAPQSPGNLVRPPASEPSARFGFGAYITAQPAGSPPYAQSQPSFGGPPNSMAYPAFPQQSYDRGPGAFAPPAQPAYPGPQAPQEFANAPMQPYPPQSFSQGQQYPGAPPPSAFPGQYAGAPPPYTSASPPPFLQGLQQPSRNMTPPTNGPSAHRLGALPPGVSGLPQRPAFGAPSPHAAQNMAHAPGMQHANVPFHGANLAASSLPMSPAPDAVGGPGYPGMPEAAAQAASSAKGDAPGRPADGARDDESRPKIKREKDKATRLVYSDNDISPEERMARLPRYAYTPSQDEEMVLGEVSPAVAGIVGDRHDVRS